MFKPPFRRFFFRYLELQKNPKLEISLEFCNKVFTVQRNKIEEQNHVVNYFFFSYSVKNFSSFSMKSLLKNRRHGFLKASEEKL